jgi:hypothetical protein
VTLMHKVPQTQSDSLSPLLAVIFTHLAEPS